jgi:transposase InsO family protein
MISNVNTTSHWHKVVQSPSGHLPHNPNMNNKPTPLSQPASPHQLLRNLPTPKLVAETLQPRLKHVGTPQLLRNQYNRRILAILAQSTQRRTRTIQRLNQGLVVYAIGCYDEINSRSCGYIICFPIQCFYSNPAIPITATFFPLPRLRKHDIQIMSDVLA